MQAKVSKGLATWAGLVAAVGQYALAVALFMDTFNDADPLAGLGPLATATVTLYGVIKGRMDQAGVLASQSVVREELQQARERKSAEVDGVLSAGLAQRYATTGTSPRVSAYMTNPDLAFLDREPDDDAEEGCSNTFEKGTSDGDE